MTPALPPTQVHLRLSLLLLVSRCHPERRSCRKPREGSLYFALALTFLTLLAPLSSQAQQHPVSHFNGGAAYALTGQYVAAAPHRWIGSPDHARAESFIADHFKPEAAKGNFEVDTFSASTPAGQLPMRNFIAKFPGKREGIIVLVSHYETNYPLRDINFVGANDGASTTALLIEIGNYLRAHPPEGFSVWLVFDDGEEAIKQWSSSDSLYGTRHLAAKWSANGTLAKVKAVLVADMLGDKDLNIDHVDNSTPWLLDMLAVAARNTGHPGNVFKYNEAEEDDHLPFAQRGVPVLDVLDAHYGPATNDTPDGYHHTAEDTMDKVSPHSLQIAGDLLLEMIHLINQHG